MRIIVIDSRTNVCYYDMDEEIFSAMRDLYREKGDKDGTVIVVRDNAGRRKHGRPAGEPSAAAEI